jgi:hypothetical protein
MNWTLAPILLSLDIKPGPYKAVFKMLGLSTAGYLSVRWGGTTDYSNSRSDGRVVACAFGSYDSDLCTGVLYLTPPEPQLTVSFYGEDDAALTGRCETNCDHIRKTANRFPRIIRAESAGGRGFRGENWILRALT